MPDNEHELPEQVLAAARDDADAYRPDRTPPFAALRARKRRRDLRRSGGAVALSVAAVAAVALGAGSLTNTADRSTPRQVAAGPPTSARGQAGPCQGTPGPCTDTKHATSSCGVTVTSSGGQQAQVTPGAPSRLRVAVGDTIVVVGSGTCTGIVSATPQGTPSAIHRVGGSSTRYEAVSPGGARLAVTAASCALAPNPNPACRGGIVPLGQVTVTVGTAPAAVLDCVDTGTLRGPCLHPEFSVGFANYAPGVTPDDAQQRAVAACLALPGAVGRGSTQSLPPTYFVQVAGDEQIAAFRACVGRVDGAVLRQVPGADTSVLARQQAFIQECLGADAVQALPAPGLVGKRESALQLAAGTRVVGRDGQCLDRTNDRQDQRLNVVVDHDLITWAGRF